MARIVEAVRVPMALMFLMALCVAVDAAEAPFSPLAGTPDYHMTMAHNLAKTTVEERIVWFHDGWAKINATLNGHLTTSHTHAKDRLRINHSSGLEGGDEFVSIERAPTNSATTAQILSAEKSDTTDTVLGEVCDVWTLHIGSVFEFKGSSRYSSCVSRDGIELQRWYGGKPPGMTAVSVERRPLQLADVAPPGNLLDKARWTTNFAAQETAGATFARPLDYTVVAKDGPVTRTTRRHFPWTYVDTVHDTGERDLRILSAFGDFNFGFKAGKGGTFEWLQITRSASPSWIAKTGLAALKVVLRGNSDGPKDLARTETVLGLDCRWFNIDSGSDSARNACQTSNGVTLKEEQWAWGAKTSTFEAVAFEEGDVPLSDVQPPDDLLKRSNWGIPD